MAPETTPEGAGDRDQAPATPVPIRPSWRGRLRTYFLTGIVVAAPITITAWLSFWFVDFVDKRVTPLIPARYNPDEYLPFSIPGLGVVIVLVVITLLGALTTNLAGRSIVRYGERWLARVPVIRTIYNTVKHIFDALIHQGRGAFTRAGLIEFPRPGLWSVVFVATATKGEIIKHTHHDDMVSVFLPTIPNPTTGFLIFVPRKDVTFLDMSVEEAAKLLLSGGLVTPPSQAVPAAAGMPDLPGAESADAPAAPPEKVAARN